MRRTAQLLLIGFYLASSVAVSQERVSLLLDEWQHATERDGTGRQINDGCNKLHDAYPRFREAKARGFEVDFEPAFSAGLSPHVTGRSFLSLNLTLKSHVAIRLSPSRAPPSVVN